MTAMKKKRNAFTLVELLVVIAILAILATVSVIGYTAFVNRANESNALSEMTQARDLIRAELMDGEEHTYDMGTSDTADDDITFTLQLTDRGLKVTASKGTTVNLKNVLTDLAELGGTFENIAVAENPAGLGNYSVTVNTITYTLESGEATAEWNIIEDTITTNS